MWLVRGRNGSQPAPQPVAAPAVATISPAQRRAYETTVRDREAQEHAQRVQVAKDAEAQKKLAEQQRTAAENQKKAELAGRQKEIAQREDIAKTREIREHRQREQARKAAEAARNAATFDFGI